MNARTSKAVLSMPQSGQPTLARSVRAMFSTRPSASRIFIDTLSMWKPANFAGNVTATGRARRPACDAPLATDVRDRLPGSNFLPSQGDFFSRAIPRLLKVGRVGRLPMCVNLRKVNAPSRCGTYRILTMFHGRGYSARYFL